MPFDEIKIIEPVLDGDGGRRRLYQQNAETHDREKREQRPAVDCPPPAAQNGTVGTCKRVSQALDFFVIIKDIVAKNTCRNLALYL